jgi:hypothetical protein
MTRRVFWFWPEFRLVSLCAAWQTLLENRGKRARAKRARVEEVPSRVGPLIAPAFFAFLPRGNTAQEPIRACPNIRCYQALTRNSKKPDTRFSRPITVAQSSGSGGAADTQTLPVANQTVRFNCALNSPILLAKLAWHFCEFSSSKASLASPLLRV